MTWLFKFVRKPSTITSWIFVVLVVIHSAWIANHLRLHAEGVINPWKGGGYGMYTNLSPGPRFIVYTDMVFPVATTPANRITKFNEAPLMEKTNILNFNRFFRCRNVSPTALKRFIRQNRSKLKRYVSVGVQERYVDQETRAAKGKIIGTFQLSINDAIASYKGTICDREPVEYTVNLRG